MFSAKFVFSSVIWALCAPSAWPQRLVPITDLGRSADLVTFAKVDQVLLAGGATSPDIVLQLQLLRTLKGAAPSSTVVAAVSAFSQHSPGPLSVSGSFVGSTGIWFLKGGTGNYRILPRAKFAYDASDLFLPLSGVGDSDAGPGDLDDLLLGFQVRWYQSLTDPTWMDDNMLLSSFEHWSADSPHPKQVLSAVAPLMKSSSPAQHAVGLAAALRAGSTDAMSEVIDELAVLRSNSRLGLILGAIGMYPKDASSIPLLQRIVGLHSDIPGVDAAAAGALRRIGTKAILPTMADLLDSKDPDAQLAVAAFLGFFTLFADAQGETYADSPLGPFATAQTRAITPRAGSSMTASEYAGSWKVWWSEHRAQLGFPAP